MLIVVDGNDGTGKTTLVAELRARHMRVADRGLPTKATDAKSPLKPIPGEVYLILDCSPETSQERLMARGANLNEEFHTLDSLRDYRERFRRVCADLEGHLIDAEGTADRVLARVLTLLGNQDSVEEFSS